MAQLVGASAHTPKKLWVPAQVGAHTGGNWSISLSVCLSLSQNKSYPQMRVKTIFKKECRSFIEPGGGMERERASPDDGSRWNLRDTK